MNLSHIYTTISNNPQTVYYVFYHIFLCTYVLSFAVLYVSSGFMVKNNFFFCKKLAFSYSLFFDFLVERFKLNCARLIALKTEEKKNNIEIYSWVRHSFEKRCGKCATFFYGRWEVLSLSHVRLNCQFKYFIKFRFTILRSGIKQIYVLLLT